VEAKSQPTSQREEKLRERRYVAIIAVLANGKGGRGLEQIATTSKNVWSSFRFFFYAEYLVQYTEDFSELLFFSFPLTFAANNTDIKGRLS
jgi:hypothetical protein